LLLFPIHCGTHWSLIAVVTLGEERILLSMDSIKSYHSHRRDAEVVRDILNRWKFALENGLLPSCRIGYDRRYYAKRLHFRVLARRQLAFSSYNRATATPGSPLWDTRDAQRNDAHPSVEFGGFESCKRSRKRSSNIL
jgi:hypothetical protein